MTKLSSLIQRLTGFYVASQILLATHAIAFLLGMAAACATAAVVAESL